MAAYSQKIETHGKFVAWVIFVLGEWRALIIASEKTLVSNVAATVPWLAPVVPAYLAWDNSISILSFPPGIAIVVAIAVEGLGMSVVSTAFELWDWNDTLQDEELSAPAWVAILAVVFYLVVVITVNVSLDLGAPAWFAKAMLSLLSVPAVVTLALRSQHTRRLESRAEVDSFEMDEQRKDREAKRQIRLEKARAQESFQKVPETFQRQESFQESSGQWRTVKKKLSSAQLYSILRGTPEALAKQYGMTTKAAQSWPGYALEEIKARQLPQTEPLPSPAP